MFIENCTSLGEPWHFLFTSHQIFTQKPHKLPDEAIPEMGFHYRADAVFIYLEPKWHLFLKVNPPKNKAFSYQNKGHLRSIGIYGSVSRVANPPPPPMVWVQNLRFGYIFMEPAKTHGIYNVLTSSASETVVFAAFCNTTLYTTRLIVLLLLLLLLQLQQQQQQQQQLLLLLLLLLRLRKNPQSKSPPPPLPQGGAGVIF